MIKKFAIKIVLLIVLCLMFGLILTACTENSNMEDAKTTVISTSDKPLSNALDKRLVTIEADVLPTFQTLMFHEISHDNVKGTTTVSKEKLEEVLKYLSENQYNFLTAQEVYDFLKERVSVPEKSIWLTFDDGLKSAYTVATPLLKKYNAKATNFVEVQQIGDASRLTNDDLKAMVESGVWDIQSHGYTGHRTPLTDPNGNKVNFYFNRLLIGDIVETEADFKRRIERDILKSFDILKEVCGSKKYFFAYPLDGETSEEGKLVDSIKSCLDNLNVLGMGVNGDRKFSVDWSNPKHCYTRWGITNSSNIKDILSLRNTGKGIYYGDKSGSSLLTNVMPYMDSRYISWNNNGDIAILNQDMNLDGGLIKIKNTNNKRLKLKGKLSFVAEIDGKVWLASWDQKKLYEISKDWVVKNQYKLQIIPSAIWFNGETLYILDSEGSIYSWVGYEAELEYKPEYNIQCTGGCASGNILYIASSNPKKIYKVDYINKEIIGSKDYSSYILVPEIADKENEFIANEMSNNVLVRVKY